MLKTIKAFSFALALVFMISCSSSDDSSSSGSTSTATSTDVTYALLGVSLGILDALSGTYSNVADQPEGNLIGIEQLAAMNLVIAEGPNKAVTTYTYTSDDGTVQLIWTYSSDYTQWDYEITFTGYTYNSYVFNGSIAYNYAYPDYPNSYSYNGTQTGTINITGAATFALVYNTTYAFDYDTYTYTCGGSFTAGGTTFTYNADCTVS